MQKLYRKLTKDQIKRGVIFSSALCYRRTDDEQGLTRHEVTKDLTLEEQDRRINNLKNDSFFNGSDYKYNLIRQ